MLEYHRTVTNSIGKILENDVIPLDSAKKTRRKTMENHGKPWKTLKTTHFAHLGDPAVMAIATAMAAASDIGPPNLDSGVPAPWSATSRNRM